MDDISLLGYFISILIIFIHISSVDFFIMNVAEFACFAPCLII